VEKVDDIKINIIRVEIISIKNITVKILFDKKIKFIQKKKLKHIIK
jgi:hypothetical protein